MGLLAPSAAAADTFKSFNSLDFRLVVFGEVVTFASGLYVLVNVAAALSFGTFKLWFVGLAFGTSFFACTSSGLCGDCFICTGVLTTLPSDSFDPLFTGAFFSSTLFCAGVLNAIKINLILHVNISSAFCLFFHAQYKFTFAFCLYALNLYFAYHLYYILFPLTY